MHYFLAIGGTILLGLLYNLVSNAYGNNVREILPFGIVALFGFLGFFVSGLGLWLIVEAGKSETKKNPS